jgi:hypothetical protein
LRPYSPGGMLIALASARQGPTLATSSIHRLGLGLPGYLILFATPAFATQRQLRSRRPLSPPVFLQISTNFTSTPGIPSPPRALKHARIEGHSSVERRDFTTDAACRLLALYAQ